MPTRSADPTNGPKSRRVRFTCNDSACGHSFTRHTRRGIYSTCPKCGKRTYGPSVIHDLAVAHATESAMGHARRGEAKRSSVPRSSSATSRPPAPAAHGRRDAGSFLSGFLGEGDVVD